MNWKRQKRTQSVLGLTLDNGRLEAVWLRRSNGSVEVKKALSTPLTLDLMRNETELVGREIRNLLDAAGVTLGDVPPHRRRATGREIVERTPMACRHRSAKARRIRRPKLPHDRGHGHARAR